MTHLRIVKRDEDHPTGYRTSLGKCTRIGRPYQFRQEIVQGQPNHNPERDRDIVKVLALILGSTFGPLALLWVACEIVTRWPK